MAPRPDAAVAPQPARADLDAVYRSETTRIVQRRVPLGILIFVVVVALAMVLETVRYPERAEAVTLLYGSELVLLALLAGVLRLRSTRRHAAAIAAVVSVSAMLCVCVYNAHVGAPAERYAMGQVCWLATASVLLPWGWRWQLMVATSSLASFLAAAPWLTTSDSIGFTVLALTVGSASTVAGAFFLAQYRRDGFIQARRQQEEAEVSATLLLLGQQLAMGLDRTDLLETVVRFTRAELECDATSVFVWDHDDQAFRLRAAVGLAPEVEAELAQVHFTRDSLPVVDAILVPDALIEIEQPGGQRLVPEVLLARWQMSSLLAAQIRRSDDVIGVLLSHYHRRTGPFTVRQRRLARGIALGTALALENARLVADLQRASRLKTEFVSTMSHELRTPLNVILGYAEMANDDGFSPADLRTHARRIETAGRELLDLIERTLEIGRMELGRDEVRLEPVRLPILWAELGASCAHMPRREAVTLAWSDAVPAVSLLTDPRKLTLIVRNLVGNALKFTERGWVRVHAEVDGDALVVRVADTGVGIRREDQDAVFEMFRQADGSDTRRFAGVGLGLYIVRRCVQQLGGAVELESRPGEGSAFTVRLPSIAARDHVSGGADASA